MGVVVEATHVTLKDRVALKFLRTPKFADQTTINNSRVGTPRAYAFHRQFTGPTKFATISPSVTCRIFGSC